MIRATAIRPAETRPANLKVCHRCGIEWDDHRYAWLAGAPCTDCREFYKAEGIKVSEFRRPKNLEEVAA